MYTLVYQVPDEGLKQMVQACQNIQAIAGATSKDKEPLTIKKTLKTFCADYVITIYKRRTYAAKELTTWSDASKVSDYNKKTAQSAYEDAVSFHQEAQRDLGVIPEDLEDKITQAKKVLLDRLVAFTSEYEEVITNEKVLIGRAVGIGKLQPANFIKIVDVVKNCRLIEALYKRQNEEVPKKVADLCKAAKEIVKKKGSK